MKLNISSRLRAAFELWILTTLGFALLRAVFYLLFYRHAESFSADETTFAFFLGLRFDMRVATVLILPILIFALPNKWHWRHSLARQKNWVLSYAILYSLLLLAYIADIGCYGYLQSRINVAIFQNLLNPAISLEMVHQTYNLYLWGPVYAALCFGLYQFFRLVIFGRAGRHARPDPIYKKATQAIQGLTLTLVTALGLYGSVSQYPLRWSQAFFTQNMFVAYLSMNPVHYLIDSLESRQQTYDIDKVKKYYPQLSKYLGVENTKDLNFRREVDQTPQFDRSVTAPNVVYIVMESMAAFKTGLFGNAADSSPELDKLANSNEGWLFRNYYTPTEGTARSLFCILTGIPDINAKSSSSRNPLIVNQNTLINGLEGYDKFYFIGGSANWGNIRGVYMNNVTGLQMYEGDSNLVGPRTDVWGLSDLDLFRATAKALSARDPKKPFFALVQSASFHRPYTIPEEHGSFQLKTLPPEELSRLGFHSLDEYNSFRMGDYSLGEFFRLIKDSEFFKNTIFIIHGDHGLPHDGAMNVGEGYKFYGLNRFHVPLVMYSPLIKEHKEYNFMMSEADVWPTVLGLTGFKYPNASLGRNVFAVPKDQPHYAFSYVYYSNPLQIMLYDQEFIAFGTEKKIEALYRYGGYKPINDQGSNLPEVTGEFYKVDLRDKYPDKFKEMSELLVGIFESSRYMLYHNPRLVNKTSP